MRVNAAALLVLITASAGCTSGTEQIAKVRALEAESAARLSIEGQVLYGTDTAKQDGYQYCTLAVGLLDRGELRLAIREASKALYLGQAGGDRCLVAFAKRDLASAYNLAGYLDRAGEFAAEALQGASSCRTNQGAVTIPATKVLGDVSLRQGRPRMQFGTTSTRSRMPHHLCSRLPVHPSAMPIWLWVNSQRPKRRSGKQTPTQAPPSSL